MTAGSVTEGLQLAREIDFDLFILDVRLPDGTGIELCQKLRESHPNVPVIYYSAYGENNESERAVATCGDAFLRKPLSIGDIEAAVERFLKPKAERDGH
jgi:DNA-binding response OmpR family regulator